MEPWDYSRFRYLLYDGTYFHQDGCHLSLMDAETQKIIAHTYAPKEGFHLVLPWFQQLQERGLDPRCFTMDGERSVMRAIRLVWPQALIQRCLYHIQREGLRWLRTFPKTQAGVELRILLRKLTAIRSFKDRDLFFDFYRQWFLTHKQFIASLPNATLEFRDLKKTMVLIQNALPDMFHYLRDPKIPHTANLLEGFYSRLKSDYRRHRGLTQENKINYLSWYCYFKNQ